MEYLSLLIPLIGIFVLVVFIKDKIVWQVLLAMILIPPIILFTFKALVEHMSVQQTEYWGGYATYATYFEEWNEEVSCRHPIYCSREVCSGSGKDRSCHSESYECGHYHLYDVDEHPATWVLYDNNKLSFDISRDTWKELETRWGGSEFTPVSRYVTYHSKKGQSFVTKWDFKEESLEATSSEHSYENKVAASDSIYKFQEVTSQEKIEWQLYDHPKIVSYYQQAILGDGGLSTEEGEHQFQLNNALLGKAKQVRVFVLLFKNSSINASIMQERYWQGGNKNEFVIPIGINDTYKVLWCKPFCWDSDNENILTEGNSRLRIDTREYVASMKQLDLKALGVWLRPQLENHWVRKEFTKLNSLLIVHISTGSIVILYILNVIFSICGVLLSIKLSDRY